MDPPPRRMRDTHMPGKPAESPERKFENRSLFLTYTDVHIPKDAYRKWFTDVVMAFYCKKGILEKLEIAHETMDQVDVCNHTHVVFKTSEPVRTQEKYAFAWDASPNMPRKERARFACPHVSVLSTEADIRLALYILGDEDPECAHLREKYMDQRPVMEGLLRIRRRGQPLEERIMALAARPSYSLRDMRFWQREVAAMIRDNKKEQPCKVNFVMAHPKAGVSVLINALKRKSPLSIHSIYGVQSPKNILAAAAIPSEIWDNDTLLLKIGASKDIIGIEETVRYTITLATALCCRNLWIFSPVFIRQVLEEPCWQPYEVRAIWDAGRATILHRRPVDVIRERLAENQNK